MRKLIIALLVLVLPTGALAGSQQIRQVVGMAKIQGGSLTTRTFDFTAESTSDPWTNANWTIIPKTDINDTARIVVGNGSNAIRPSSDDDLILYWNADTFADKQYSSVVVDDITLLNDYNGPAVRVQSDFSCYFASIRYSDRVKVFKVVAGTPPTYTELGSTTTDLTIANGDTITLRVNGSTLQVLQNGSQIGVDRTDSTYSSGKVGILWDSIGPTYDSWGGGEW